MIKKAIFVLCLCFSFNMNAFAASNAANIDVDSLFLEGKKAYKEGSYTKAEIYYITIEI